MDASPRRARSAELAIAVAVVVVPLVVAVAVLSARRWYPVLDLAMTELRLRDVGTRRTPLIGLPGRIGTFPDQGSHPGPLSFWLLAPGYRLFGSSAWAIGTSLTGDSTLDPCGFWMVSRYSTYSAVAPMAALASFWATFIATFES